jgi:hypothetical protein
MIGWHTDTDNWCWAVYEAGLNGETAHIYIIPQKDGKLNIVDAFVAYEQSREGGRPRTSWIKAVENGEGTAVVAGPFDSMKAAQAAWKLIYG